ncbi:MAG TPA: ABC transporter ATP-binding protein [Ktedonobacteraceae bacterium]|nr:ABC transporter ATP-binding protein [Ktedonobacteraceae bacterium]
MKKKSEFTVAGAHQYNLASPVRWIISHLMRYVPVLACFILLALLANVCYALMPVLIGNAFTSVLQKQPALLGLIALSLLALALIQGSLELGAHYQAEVLGKRFTRDAREEFYSSLLGKSQTFHNRQSVGDIMARASNDMTQIGNMVSPAFDAIFFAASSLLVTLFFIGSINLQLLLVPCLFIVACLIALRHYSRQLTPIATRLRAEFGGVNAVLNEAIAGIEVVKATAQEEQETKKFLKRVSRYRDLYTENGKVQGRFLPILIFGISLAFALLHGLWLLSTHTISPGNLIAFIGLTANLRTMTTVSYWTFSLIQRGLASSRRVLGLIMDESELDENEDGYQKEMRGEVVFEHVSFSYGDTPVLQDISFHAKPGQTLAIVGQVGSGKSSLTKLINRIYDSNDGQILLDGVNVRDWNLNALRSHISTIEQDVFLFSRSIAENITYGLGHAVDQETLEAAARDAQAHEFIQRFPDGYATEIGTRGVTLSGGQRQRLAIARALLTNPRILILDDATSAIDSATEDEIQKALRRVQQGRTTFLITHRLSLIRQADSVLILDQGRLADQGTHEELLHRCALYQRLFVRHETPLPASVSAD